MPLSAGDKLGPYVVMAPIGAGGMGEVYKARDTRLDRTVAIKISNADKSPAAGAFRGSTDPFTARERHVPDAPGRRCGLSTVVGNTPWFKRCN